MKNASGLPLAFFIVSSPPLHLEDAGKIREGMRRGVLDGNTNAFPSHENYFSGAVTVFDVVFVFEFGDSGLCA